MRTLTSLISFTLLSVAACGGDDAAPDTHDPDTAAHASIDRFSAEAGTLMVRDGSNGLPAADEPVDFDVAPFITTGFGPDGEVVRYYNFDVQPVEPAPIYVLFREGEDAPVAGQLDVVDVIPGDVGYNDFWQVVRVTVEADYVANEVASLGEILDRGYDLEPLDALVNCPIVPGGSTATLRLADEAAGLTRGWYGGEIVEYFNFAEASLAPNVAGEVRTSPIFVTFNTNPDQPDGGPPSGFVTEPGSEQTHNVVATMPGEPGYSPLWEVDVYDNADFDAVSDLATAQTATILAEKVATVNCPLVSRAQR